MGGLEGKSTGIHQKTIRLNKFLSMAGVGSRRKNDELILSGAVHINGRPVTELGVQVDPTRDKVAVNGNVVLPEERKVYLLFNKPKDTITTMSDEKGRSTVMEYIHVKQRVFPIGRLDRNTTGILLMTNDGELANALIHPKFEVEKMYRVTVDRSVRDDELKRLRKGVRLDDGLAKAKEVEIIQGSKRKKILITLQEGRNREVRRMFEVLGLDVSQLDRVMFAGLTPLGVPRGEWRHLTRAEVEYLFELTGVKE
jgi:23S rRNA pseudouridine2605 synthase